MADFTGELAIPMIPARKVFLYYFIMKSDWISGIPMSMQKVFVFWVTPLFYETICRLLKHPEIKLVGESSNYIEVASDIVKKEPTTIIIEDTGKQHSEMINQYLDLIPWAVKIILLGLNENKLVVYHHEQRSMVQTEDLLYLVFSKFG